MSKSSKLAELKVVFGDKQTIKAVLCARFLQWSEGTIRNKIENGTFPIPVITIKSKVSNDKKHVRHYIKLADLADYLARAESDSALPLGKRRVGRPSKASQLFRQQLQSPSPTPTRKPSRPQPVF